MGPAYAIYVIITYHHFTPIKIKPQDKNCTVPTRIIRNNSNKHSHFSYFQECFGLCFLNYGSNINLPMYISPIQAKGGRHLEGIYSQLRTFKIVLWIR